MEEDNKYKKELNVYIKESLSKGYSLESIKKAFITLGYDSEFAEKLIKTYKIRNIITKTSSVFLVLLLLIPAILFYKPGITTFAVITQQYNFTDNIGLDFNESTEYVWNLENKGFLKSVKLNGEVHDSGTVKIYLEHANDTYLIFNNKKLGKGNLKKITTFAVKEVEIETAGNLTFEVQIIIDNLVADINKTRNNVEIEIEIEDDKTKKEIDGYITDAQELLVDTLMSILRNKEIKIKIKSDFDEIEIPEEVINETNVSKTINITPIINETINITFPINETNITVPLNETIINETNVTLPVNGTIKINLEYKKGTIYDKNNEGIENIDGVIDLTVENTRFNWDVKEENLCTRWGTYSVEDKESTIVCYGSQRCCNFVDLLAAKPLWNEPFYSAYGQYGATLNNIISSQVLYVDYNLSLTAPYAEVYYSDWENLTTEFYHGFIRFENICIESCILPNLNATSYKLIFKIKNSKLILDSIRYEVLTSGIKNNPPILLNNFSNISILKGKSHTINLSGHFYDQDNDTLMFDYYNNSKIDVLIINETAILTANDFTGTSYMFFTANDSIETATSNIFKVEIKERKINLGVLKSLRQLIELW